MAAEWNNRNASQGNRIAMPMTRLNPTTLAATMTLLGVLAGAAMADEPPHLDFVRGLRARGMPDLALEYLEKLKREPPENLAVWLPFEMAETRLDMARFESDGRQRVRLYTVARQEFDTFLRRNPAPLLTSEARLEIARIASLMGQAQLRRAWRQESATGRRALETKARQQLGQAARLLSVVIRETNQLTAEVPPEQNSAFDRVRGQAELEIGLAAFWEMKTYDDSADVLQRGELAKKSIEALEPVGRRADAMGWEARAWIGRCHAETDEPVKAEQELQRIIDSTEIQAETGKRLARYVRLLIVDKSAGVKEPLAAKQKYAEEWLLSYPNFTATVEGAGVRFQLAEACMGQVQKRPLKQQNKPEAQQLLNTAEKLYQEVAQADSEFSHLARARRMELLVTLLGERSRGDVNELHDFKDGFARAHLEIRRLASEESSSSARAIGDTKSKTKERQRHYDIIISALRRALTLADPDTAPADLDEARYILAYVYLITGQPYQAATLGEHLARTWPSSERAPAAAAYALEAYAQILALDEREGSASGNTEVDRGRLHDLARYAEKTWPDEPATDVARHQLGALAFADKKYQEAIDVLCRISPEYGGYTSAQYQLACAALHASKEELVPSPHQPPFEAQAMLALKRVPTLASGADSATAQVYFYAKLQLAKLLFARRQYEQMEVLTNELLKQFGDAKLDDQTRNNLRPAVEGLPLYALYGRARLEFQQGRYDDVSKMIAPVADRLRRGELPDTRDPRLLRGLLGLALRANVMAGDTNRAADLLGLLLRDTGTNLDGAGAVLAELIQELRLQIDELRKRGPSAEPEVGKTAANLTAFLDSLARQPPDKLTPDVLRFVASAYASLDKHEQAAEQLGRISAPERPDPDLENSYHAVRLMYARELRLANQTERAGQALKEILSADWGKKSVDARKEQILLLEDQQKFAHAAQAWTELLNNLRRQIEKNGKLKEQYFDCYYHLVTCRYKHALKLTDDDKRRNGIRRAAGLIVKLEVATPDMGSDLLKKRYEALLQQETPLREQYEALKKESP
jgi:hypothetical protein